jgi:hypothetical protein
LRVLRADGRVRVQVDGRHLEDVVRRAGHGK